MSSPAPKQQRMQSTDHSFLGFTDPKIVAAIIQHLTVADLLQLTTVSKQLNEIISYNAPYMMAAIGKQLQLTIAENWTREFEFADVAETKRKYQSLHVKSLLRRPTEVLKVIVNFSQSLTTISTAFDFDLKDVHLPLVKTLEMRIADGRFHESGLLTAVNRLETLKLWSLNLPKDCNLHTMIARCLSINPKLQVLEVEERLAYEVFSRLHRNYFDFRLRRFAIVLPDNQCDVQNFFYNLKNFVISQSSLVDLKLMKIPFSVMLQIMSELDDVERLTYSDGMNSDVHTIYGYGNGRLPVKESVRELRLVCDEKFRLALKLLLCRFVNLERVYYAMPDLHVLRDIVKYPKIAEISYAVYHPETEEQLQRGVDELKSKRGLPETQMQLSIKQI